MRWRLGLRHAIRTAPPVRDLGLIDLVAPVVDRSETGSGADRAVDVDHTAADSTDQMMVVVVDVHVAPLYPFMQRPVCDSVQ